MFKCLILFISYAVNLFSEITQLKKSISHQINIQRKIYSKLSGILLDNESEKILLIELIIINIFID